MRQSNIYIIFYAVIITIVSGGLLAFASQALKPLQDANVELERKKNILSTVMSLKEGDNINEIYASRVKELVIDFNGNVKDGQKASEIDVAKEYKKAPQERLLPVYEFRDSEKLNNVVLPVYGFGLWNDIWGFVALQQDLNTIQGVSFQHKGETPGLGARIVSDEIQDRFKGKSIFDNDVLQSVFMQKGEGFDYSNEPHKVDGMSGATLTAKGVNNMLQDYFNCYLNYLKKNQQNLSSTL
ncbi:MAG: NADH:ubiquinone reductase (Na(+)-transporting) subunit C [Cyclobacteriaceae bacterium]|nr:NADH:ubiquinone reductase (Na(+)-transporting) subunit C [Cytophagales bacterium]MBX2898227.1 NADH:ubiquinone reductase (Na(+)-transporting) subunit C [Cyclobacteriaceae bacterium]